MHVMYVCLYIYIIHIIYIYILLYYIIYIYIYLYIQVGIVLGIWNQQNLNIYIYSICPSSTVLVVRNIVFKCSSL